VAPRSRDRRQRMDTTPASSSRSDTGLRREARCRSGRIRRSSGARTARCSCTPVPRRARTRRCRPSRPRNHLRRPRRRRHHRLHPGAGRPRRDIRRRSRRRCRARNRDTRPDSAHSRQRHLPLVRLLQLRPRSTHRLHPHGFGPSIHRLQPRAKGGEPRSAASRAPVQHHACHSDGRGNFARGMRSAPRMRPCVSQSFRKLRRGRQPALKRAGLAPPSKRSGPPRARPTPPRRATESRGGSGRSWPPR
jgi:hypothetical protein